MMEQQLVVDALRSATEGVFSTMLGLEVESGEPFVETEDPGPSEGIIGLIGLAGTWVGTVSFRGCRVCVRRNWRIADRIMGRTAVSFGLAVDRRVRPSRMSRLKHDAENSRLTISLAGQPGRVDPLVRGWPLASLRELLKS